jgi:steroid delta-isomerase-like uncharacterized protein
MCVSGQFVRWRDRCLLSQFSTADLERALSLQCANLALRKEGGEMDETGMAVCRRWFEEVWNEGREDLMPQLAAEDVIAHGIAGPDDVAHGLEAGFKPMYRTLRGAFPDIHFTVDEIIGSGELAAARWSMRGTHRGGDLGMPATGKQVAITGMTFVRVTNGKIAEGWNNWDMMGLMNQIGANAARAVIPTERG